MERLWRGLPKGPVWNFLWLLLSLLLFFVSLDLLGEGFEALGEGAAKKVATDYAPVVPQEVEGEVATDAAEQEDGDAAADVNTDVNTGGQEVEADADADG
ncbi:MAG: hypothetical protein ICV62_16765 [Cyanobacteria bacterium Co-bin13]|nr:hypothetical protein [Cyanobacteria bacterium Co-bin13]